MPQHAHDVRHEPQHAARPLKLLQPRPVLGQAVEQLGVDRVGQPQQLVVSRLLRLGREVGDVLAIEIVERTAGLVPSPLAVGIERLEKAPADDLVSLVARRGQPSRVDAAEHGLQPPQRLRPALAASFHVALRQRADHEHAGRHLRGLGQRLDEGQERLEPAVRQLAGIGHQLVQQDHGGPAQTEQKPARPCSCHSACRAFTYASGPLVARSRPCMASR